MRIFQDVVEAWCRLEEAEHDFRTACEKVPMASDLSVAYDQFVERMEARYDAERRMLEAQEAYEMACEVAEVEGVDEAQRRLVDILESEIIHAESLVEDPPKPRWR